MPRRDWNAKRERRYERVNEGRAQTGSIRFGRKRSVRALRDADPKRPRSSPGTRGAS